MALQVVENVQITEVQGMKGSKLRHDRVTQTLPNSVPRTNLIYSRGGIFYFRLRISN